MLKPGQPLPAEISMSMTSLAGSAATVTVLARPDSSSSLNAAATAMGNTTATGESSAQKSKDSPALSTTAIVGVAMGSVAIFVLVGGLFW